MPTFKNLQNRQFRNAVAHLRIPPESVSRQPLQTPFPGLKKLQFASDFDGYDYPFDGKTLSSEIGDWGWEL